jgi:hypothetical protein
MTEPIDRPGPDHRAEPALNPNKAFWRTALQVGPLAAVSLLLILPEILQSIVDGFGRDLPPEVYGVLVSITGGITLVAAITAKVMANAKAIEWFRKYAPFFAPDKK